MGKVTVHEIKYLTGTLYLLYGIIKVSVGISLLLIPSDKIKKLPVLKLFAAELEDTTLAGRLYEYVLIIFGIYTIIFGLALFNLYPYEYRNFLENKYTEYSVFIIIGLILTIFYSLVLYTKLPISKNMKYEDHYKLLGLIGGLSFLVMPLIWEILEYINPVLNNMSYELRSLTILGGSILFIIILGLIYTFYIKDKKKFKAETKDIIESKIPIHIGSEENVATIL